MLTYRYTRNVEWPGLVVHLLGGPGPLPGDAPFGAGSLLFASGAWGLLENLQPAHVRIGGISKALPLVNVEERVEMVRHNRGGEGLNILRDQTREVAAALGSPTELVLLQRIVGALLSMQSSKILPSPMARARALGLLFDAGRIEHCSPRCPVHCAWRCYHGGPLLPGGILRGPLFQLHREPGFSGR